MMSMVGGKARAIAQRRAGLGAAWAPTGALANLTVSDKFHQRRTCSLRCTPLEDGPKLTCGSYWLMSAFRG
jgi:hypothetical protein